MHELRGAGRYRTALGLILKILDHDPWNHEAFYHGASILSLGRTGLLTAVEPLGVRDTSDQRLNPVWAVCSECTRSWVPDPAYFGSHADQLVIMNPVGLQCPACGYTLCYRCLNADSLGLGVSVNHHECPNGCGVELSLPVQPTGRETLLRRRPEPISHVFIFREGQIPPDTAYIQKMLETCSPDVFDSTPEIVAAPVGGSLNDLYIYSFMRASGLADDVIQDSERATITDSENNCQVHVVKAYAAALDRKQPRPAGEYRTRTHTTVASPPPPPYELVHSAYADKLHCPACGSSNSSSQWPTFGDLVPHSSQLKPATFSVTVKCPHCHVEWYIVWDNDPGPVGRFLPAGSPPAHETVIEHILAGLERKLRASGGSPPVVSLRLQTTELGKQIVWLYKTDHEGAEIDPDMAGCLLNAELKPYGLKAISSGYMGGGIGHEGEMSRLFDYIQLSPESARFAEQVDMLDKLDGQAAHERGAELLKTGETGVLLAWLRDGKYPGIPQTLLTTCANQDIAQALIAVLQDSSSPAESRIRAASALGPLGGRPAAEALCLVLRQATDYLEIAAIAGAISRLAWSDAKEDLIDAARRVPNSPGLGVRAAIGMALVTVCSAGEGFALLFEAAQQDGDLTTEQVEAAALGDDDRAVPLMTYLSEHSANADNRRKAEGFLARRQASWHQ